MVDYAVKNNMKYTVYRSALGLTLVVSALLSAFATMPALAEDGKPSIQEVIVTTERREVNLQDLGGTAVSFTGEELALQGIQDITDLSESVVGLEIGNARGNVEVWIRGVGSPNNTELGDPAAAMHIDGVYIPRPRGIGGAFFDLNRVEVNVGPQGTLRGRNAMAGSINAIPWHPGLDRWDLMVELEKGNYSQDVFQFVTNIPLGDEFAMRFAYLKQDHDSYYNDVGPFNIRAPEAADNTAARLQFLWQPTDRLRILAAGDYLTEQGTGYTGTNFANPLGNGVDAEDIDDPRDVYLRGISPIQDTKHWGLKLQVNYDFDIGTLEFTYGHRDLLYDYQASTPLSPDYPDAVANLGGPLIFEAIDDYSPFQDVTDSVSDVFELRFYTDPENTVYYTAGLFYFIEDQYSFLGATGDGQNFFQGIEFNQPNTDTESLSVYGDVTWNYTDETRFTFGLRFTDDHKDRQGVNAQYRVSAGGTNLITGATNVDGLGFRFGTEGFEFAIRDREIFNPDTDNDGDISEDEYFEFILDGIKTPGARDTFHIALRNELNDVLTPCEDFRLGDDLTCPDDGFYAFIGGTASRASVTPQKGEIDENFVDWRVRVEHDVTEENLLYLLIATGHKSGGFNDTFSVPVDDRGSPVVPPEEPVGVRFQNGLGGDDNTYTTEKVTFYELGSKNEFEIGGIPGTLNGSLFFQDYTDQVFCNVLSVGQVLARDPSAELSDAERVSLGVNFCFNSEKTEIYGSQLEGSFYFAHELTFKWSALWLETQIRKSNPVVDSRFQPDDPDEGDGAVPVDITGNRLPRSPRYSLNLSLSQQIELDIGSLDYILSASWRDEQHMDIFNGIDYQQPDNPRKRLDDLVNGYWTFDFGAGLNIGDSKFRVETFVNNITNEVRPAAIIIRQYDNTRFYTRPRTYGARIRWQL